MALKIAEQLMYSAMQIELLDASDNITGYASGFIYSFCHNQDTQEGVRALVTNRHVLEKYQKIRLFFTKRSDDESPIQDQHITVTTSTVGAIYHPDNSIDLAVLPLHSVLEAIHQAGEKEFFYYIESSSIPSDDTWNQMNAVEDLLMVGYPMGVRDKINNLPVFRKGITATHPKFGFQGKPQFLMDMSCFRGSSGSPIYRYSDGTLRNNDTNSISFGTRCELIGIQYQSTTYSEIGDIVPVSTDVKLASSTTIFINLGYALKSTLLLDFESIIRKMIGK